MTRTNRPDRRSSKPREVSIETVDHRFSLTATKLKTGTIFVTKRSLDPKETLGRADIVEFSLNRPVLAWKRLSQPIIGSSGTHPFYVEKAPTEYNHEIDGERIKSEFARLIEEAVKQGWGAREIGQLEVIALRSDYPDVNRPVSSLLRTTSLGFNSSAGVVVVGKNEDVGVEIVLRGFPDANGARLVQSFSLEGGFNAEIESTKLFNRSKGIAEIDVEEFHKSLREAMPSIVKEMFSNKRWGPSDISEFLATCQKLDSFVSGREPLVKFDQGFTIPFPNSGTLSR